VQLGSHTRSHRDLRTLTDDELRDELEGAAERIAEVARRPDVLAYPYGFADGRVAEAAREVYSLLEGYGTWRFAAYVGIRRLGRRARRAMARS
jgi:peptidoglycan/xylan/chitin deacetylase (PgdA/CDA1 family)